MIKTIKLTTAVVVTMFTMTLHAQVVTMNNMSSIKPGAKINYVVDFSQASIMGMTETDFSNYEKDWQEDKLSVIGKFQKGANSKLDGILRLGSYKDSPYTLKVSVISVTDLGNIICEVSLSDTEGTELFHVKNVNGGKEPPFLPGTKLAKIKVWANLTGRSLGNILKSEYLGQ